MVAKYHDRERNADMSSPVQRQKWTLVEFYDLGDRGFFDQGRVMLIDGEIFELRLASPPHATAEALTKDVLRSIFCIGFIVRIGQPLPIGRSTDPVPDLAVVTGSIRDYAQSHPTSAVLIVEISDSSLDFDLGDKASLYASAAIADYWVVDLVNRQLVVMRTPSSTRPADLASDTQP